MAEVLRLLRLSLILRVAIALAATVIGGTVIGGNSLITALLVLPSCVLLGVAFVALRRGRTDARFVNGLLVATIVAQTAEEVGMRLLLRNNLIVSQGLEVRLEMPRESRSPFEILFTRNLFGGPLLTAIPAILGAWISGKRGAIKWAIFATAVSAAGDLLTFLPNVEFFRFISGSIASQGMVTTVLAFFVGSLADQLRSEQTQLQTANQQLREQAHVREQLAGSRERVRLARELHDTLAHTLAGLVVQMNAIGTLLDKEPQAARIELKKAQTAAKTGLEETRAAISDLRANVVEDLGLSGALKRQADVMQQRLRVPVAFQQSGEEPVLNNGVGESLFRIAQEAMNNVERHANAKTVAVALTTRGANVDIVVRDDGVGFDTSALESDRFGLRGMRERAELIGAHLRVDSTPNHGTTVTVSLRPTST
jgi:signal transduction histidine kinase